MERSETNSGIDAKRLGARIRRDRESFFDSKDSFIEEANEVGADLSPRKLGRIERGEQPPTTSELTAIALTLYLDQWESGLVSMLRESASVQMFLDMTIKSLAGRKLPPDMEKAALAVAILKSIDDEYKDNPRSPYLMAEMLKDDSFPSIPADLGGLE